MSSSLFPKFALTTILVSLAAGSSPLAAAGSEPEPLKNLRYFPKDTNRADLISRMRDFSFALGVACTHCHGTQEQEGFNLRGVDFSLDEKPAKAKARDMLRMQEKINLKLLARIPASKLNLQVRCFTCHSGMALPEAIESRVIRIVHAEGWEAAIEDYRSTRRENHGSAAYNFNEQPLVEAAALLHEEGQYAAASAISKLNLEFHPDSGQSKFRLAEAYFELGDRTNARRVYREILKARPDDRRIKVRLEELGEPQR